MQFVKYGFNHIAFAEEGFKAVIPYMVNRQIEYVRSCERGKGTHPPSSSSSSSSQKILSGIFPSHPPSTQQETTTTNTTISRVTASTLQQRYQKASSYVKQGLSGINANVNCVVWVFSNELIWLLVDYNSPIPLMPNCAYLLEALGFDSLKHFWIKISANFGRPNYS